jgi:hypothetical protein
VHQAKREAVIFQTCSVFQQILVAENPTSVEQEAPSSVKMAERFAALSPFLDELPPALEVFDDLFAGDDRFDEIFAEPIQGFDDIFADPIQVNDDDFEF